MRNLLLATSALVVAGSMFAGSAMAQNKPISLGLGGYFNYAFGIVSQDDGLGQAANPVANQKARDHGFLSDGEIHIRGSTTLDNGLMVGVQVELEATTSQDQIDETYMYFRSAQFGELRVGQDDGAANQFASIGAPSPIARFGINAPANVFTQAPVGHRAGQNVDIEVGQFHGDAEKVTYFSPTIAGFRIGISYTPDATETGSYTRPAGNSGTAAAGSGPTIGWANVTPLGLENQAGAQGELWDLAGTYNQTIQGVGISLAAGYTKGKLEIAAAGADDRTAWGLGGQLSYMGFTVGGAYRSDDQGLTGNNELTAWTAGIQYTMGPWAVSAGYGIATVEGGVGFAGEDETKTYEIAVQYTLGPGIEVYAGLVGMEYTNNADQASAVALLDNDTTTFFVGSRLAF